jgi:hypothetical protein
MINEKRQRAVVSFSTSGANEIIAAPTGDNEYIVIDHLNLIPNSAVTMTIKSGTTALSGAYSLTANQGYTVENMDGDEDGILKCAINEAFNITLGGAVQCSGFIKYRIRNR